jgi:hypothetical protein
MRLRWVLALALLSPFRLAALEVMAVADGVVVETGVEGLGFEARPLQTGWIVTAMQKK